MPTTPPTITSLPAVPDRADRPTFSARATAYFDALKNNFTPEVAALAANVHSNATEAATSADTATAQVALAAAQVDLATVQAVAAAGSAAVAGAVEWVSGQTYAVGDARYSPINLKTYRRKVAGAGTTDPSLDLTNWALAVDTSAKILRSARTSNTALTAADNGKLIDITSGNFTQTFDAAATLGDGWFVYLRNSGTGDITLDPNGAETIDGLTNSTLRPGDLKIVQCDGASLRSVGADTSGKVPVGGMIPLDSLTEGSLVTYPNGDVYLKTGILALSSEYPDATHSYNTTERATVSFPGGPNSSYTMGRLCYGNGAWVGCNQYRELYTSTDGGATWVKLPVSVSSVTFGGGKFVAVDYLTAYTSTDGINWTSHNNVLPISSVWAALGFGNGVYVAVSNTVGANGIAVSTDGVTWTGKNNPMPSIVNSRSATCGGQVIATNGTGTWVVASNNYSVSSLAVSTNNGDTWTSVSTSNSFGNVVFGGDTFVAVASGTGAAWSTNGTTWTSSSMSNSLTNAGVFYNGYQFIAYAPNTGTVCCYSPNGSSWTNATSENYISAVATDGTIWLATSFQGSIKGSITGQAFVGLSTGTPLRMNYAGGKYFASTAESSWFGLSYNGGKSFVHLKGLTNATACAQFVTYFNNLYVISDGSSIYTCPTLSPSNGAWTTRTASYKGGPLEIANNVLFVFHTTTSTGFSYSLDGTSYSNVTGLVSSSYSTAVFAAGVYLVKGSGTQIYIATDPSGTWTSVTMPASTYNIYACSGKFVAVTVSGFYTSTNGTTWTIVPGSSVGYTINYGSNNTVMSFNPADPYQTLVYSPTEGRIYQRDSFTSPNKSSVTQSTQMAGPEEAVATTFGKCFTFADVVINDRAEYTSAPTAPLGQQFYRRIK